MIEKPKAENCFDVYEEYTKTGEEILVYRSSRDGASATR